ncbi:methyltransferase domain-containing protein [Candidatus Campbellbacteria bacterium]|nr:MAG: methyltransferase domain-containing protein [Candidatus Campbellbacteria bacterium]
MNVIQIIKGIIRGQSLVRILMNESLSEVIIDGKVLDVGGARSPDYFNFLKKKGDVDIDVVDGSIQEINFEKDPLPYISEAYKTIIVCNVLEHVFNHEFLTREMFRVLKKEGSLVGFVPFFVQYHPDPHDYFRYTKESLIKILGNVGFVGVCVREIGGGPFFVSFNTVMLSIPRVFRALIFPVFLFLDRIFLWFRPCARERFPLGYLFLAKK